MRNMPYAICRLESANGSVTGYFVVSPYHAELRMIESDDVRQLTVEEPLSARLWQELRALGGDENPRRLDQHMGEIFMLSEEFTRDSAILLAVEALTIGAPRFAPDRLGRRLGDWVDAERRGTPLCPFKCRLCRARLRKTGTIAVANPEDVRRLTYSCPKHESQEAEYSPPTRGWVDTRN